MEPVAINTTTTTTAAAAVAVDDTQQQQPKQLIVRLRTLPGFDPDGYSEYGVYQHQNFMFSYVRRATVSERVLLWEQLIRQVDRRLDAAVDQDEPLDPQRHFIRNERGKVVATGNFVDLDSAYMRRNGLADAGDPWTYKGKQVPIDWRYYPSRWIERAKQAGEALAVKVTE